MAVQIFECNCPQPVEQFICGEAVVENSLCLLPAIPTPDSVTIEPLVPTFQVEFICCNLVVVCGLLRKTITFTEGTATDTIVRDIPIQAHVQLCCDDISVPLTTDNVTVNDVEVCGGCFRLLCPIVHPEEPVIVRYDKIKEKDVLKFEFRVTTGDAA